MTSVTPEPMCSGIATDKVSTMAMRLVSNSQPTERNPMLRSLCRLPTYVMLEMMDTKISGATKAVMRLM